MNSFNVPSINIKALSPSGSREVVGVLLAGGRSSRFGGDDKCLQLLNGKTMLERVALKAAPQVGALVLNANGDTNRFPDLGMPVIKDSIDDFAGPLAGVLTAMDFAAKHVPQARWVASFATDAPFVPGNWVSRVLAAITREGADMGTVSSNDNTHPVFGLWPVSLRFELRKAMEREDIRKVRAWTSRYKVATVAYELGEIDPFFNINTQDDLNDAENRLASTSRADAG
ncbi:molybdenum cofactor guanylyltransferase MobA [Magnetovibrio sp.]|uniref:molybdenum cofactor guanylyltransferase MobA n=1 Tax=Magnetovibrio sp. TaxID=2024836 RepID=UPI002F93E7D4